MSKTMHLNLIMEFASFFITASVLTSNQKKIFTSWKLLDLYRDSMKIFQCQIYMSPSNKGTCSLQRPKYPFLSCCAVLLVHPQICARFLAPVLDIEYQIWICSSNQVAVFRICPFLSC